MPVTSEAPPMAPSLPCSYLGTTEETTTLDALLSHVAFLADHVVAVVFCAVLIEAAGIPFPSRLILVLAAATQLEVSDLVELALAATAGATIGDHVPYLVGRQFGPRVLALYCRITLGSERCVDRTIAYFRRFGGAAILLSRFSASVRLFASVLSGCGYISSRLWRRSRYGPARADAVIACAPTERASELTPR